MIPRTLSRLLVVLSLVLTGVAPALAQQVRFGAISRDVVESRLREAPKKDAERESLMEKIFRDAGCAPDQLGEQKVAHQKLPNVICVLPGETDEKIVVGAHYDHVSAGAGVVDNWSGASLLPSLLEVLRQTPRRHTYVFIAFSAEEKGLVGSRFFVKQLSASERAKIEAMINMDTLGLSPTKVWVTQADPKLVQAIAKVANSVKLPVSEMDVDKVGEADSISFKRAGIPSITIHSVTQETWPILHTSKDQLGAIHLDDYYDSFRLISVYLAYLDQTLEPSMDSSPTMGKYTSGQTESH